MGSLPMRKYILHSLALFFSQLPSFSSSFASNNFFHSNSLLLGLKPSPFWVGLRLRRLIPPSNARRLHEKNSFSRFGGDSKMSYADTKITQRGSPFSDGYTLAEICKRMRRGEQ